MKPVKPDRKSELLEPLRPQDDDALELKKLARTLVIVPVLAPPSATGQQTAMRTPASRLEEAVGLARAINLDIARSGTARISHPRPSHLFGAGKVEELRAVVQAEEIELVIVDHALTPGQQRNLERAWRAKVIDRTGLILEIFADRAQTREGTLQVELAHLTYQKSRLVRSWTHLERQRGGFGFLGGPGETQIEADKRHISVRIDAIKRELEGVKRTRKLHRSGRSRVPYPVVALVGYTNAGKSTLFNHMTKARVLARDQLFATLDPTMREITMANGRPAILSDTVGFISDLPTSLIAAFRATLEEVIEADLILHVRDIAHEDTEAQRLDVHAVLKDLGIDAGTDECNILEIWNKADLVTGDERENLANATRRAGGRTVLISAKTGAGLDELLEKITELLTKDHKLYRVTLGVHDRAQLSWLYEHGTVHTTKDRDDGGVVCDVTLAPDVLARLKARTPDAEDMLEQL